MSPAGAEQVNNLNQAIAALEAQRQTLGDAVVDSALAPLREKLAEVQSQRLEQQRKLATILFTDVVGSTRIAQQLDPEEVVDLMDGALKRLAGPVEGHGGHVTRFQGDGFKAVFGLPVAHENDPEMAIRAGLGILETAQEIAKELERDRGIPSFQVRVGINTGLVAAGGQTEAEDTVMGEAVNLAARLESAAPPGGVLISHDTYRHVRGVFDVEPLDPIQAKGFPDPVPVYLVKRARPWSLRLVSRGVEGIETRMIGRTAELRRLQDALDTLIQEGEGQMITVVGEAGVGKSRLLYEFLNRLEHLSENIIPYQGRGRHDSQNRPYSLLRDVFISRFQIEEADRAPAVRAKFEQGLSEAFEPGLASEPAQADQPLLAEEPAALKAHVVGQLLGFDFSASPHLKSLRGDPQGLRDRGLIYLGEYFKNISSHLPAVIFLEDIHWADDSSLDAINHIARKSAGQRLLIVCLARPALFERRPSWGEGQNYHTRIALRSLSKRESWQLIEEILKKVDQIPERLRQLVIERAEGNPFYIEELLKMLIEEGVIIKEEQHWRVALSRLKEVHVPATLTGVLQARLDSLPRGEREMLQHASVVGRIFWDRVVAYINAAGRDDEINQEIKQMLSTLRNKEMVFRREGSAFAGTREYFFKHEILREVTYETVLMKLRRVYHSLVADWLIEHGTGRAAEYIGLIGDHLEQAGKIAQAADYLLQAGQFAQHVYANEECIRYYHRSLDLMAQLVDEPERNQTRAETFERLGDVLELTGRNAEAREAYQARIALLAEGESLWRARLTGKIATTLREEASYDMALQTYLSAEAILGEVPGERDGNWQKEWLDIQLNRMLMHYWLGEEDEAERLANRARPVVERYGNPIQQGRFFLTLGRVDFRRDRFMVSAETVERSRQGFAMMQKAGRLHEKAESSFHLAFCLLWHGNLPEAETRFLSSLRLAEQTGDITMQSRSLTYLTVLYRKLRRVDAVRDYASRSLPASQEANIPVYIAMARANQAWLAFREGNLAQAEAQARAAMEIWQGEPTPPPMQWAALWPLIAVALSKKRLDAAVNYARALLDPRQQKLPDVLNGALEQSILLFDGGQTEASTEHLGRAMQLAEDLGCF